MRSPILYSRKENSNRMLHSYAQNRGETSFIKEILEGVNPQIDSNTVIAGDLTPWSHQ